MKTQYKILFAVPLFALTMSACKTFYANTFVMTHNKKLLVKDANTEEERLIDCSKSGQDTKQLLSDLPYFVEGDPIKVKTTQRYDGFRVFKIDETVLKYNEDSIQIRKDKEVINAFKVEANQQQR